MDSLQGSSGREARRRAPEALAQALGATEAPRARPEDEQGSARAQGNKRPTLRLAMVAGAVVLIAGALAFWLHSRRFESTDDAQIDGDITAGSPRVAGTVMAVHVQDNQQVRAGDLLIELDPADLR